MCEYAIDIYMVKIYYKKKLNNIFLLLKTFYDLKYDLIYTDDSIYTYYCKIIFLIWNLLYTILTRIIHILHIINFYLAYITWAKFKLHNRC